MAAFDSDPRLITAQKALKASLAKLPVHCTMMEPLRPQHFITRQNGTMIPLVALDELPATVALRGVPRTLSPYDVAGMTGLGTVDSQHRQYIVDGPRQGFRPEQKVAENDLLASKYATAPTNYDLESSLNGLGLRSRAAAPPAVRPQPKAYGIKETRSALPSSLRKESMSVVEPTSRPLTIEDLARHPAPGVKEYCSYWLRHGECDYAQQGCLYRHEMPLDPPTLEKLGLRDIPRWYREKHGLGSYLALSAQRAGATGSRLGLMERNWRSNQGSVPSEGVKTPIISPGLQNKRGNSSGSSPTCTAVNSWNAFANKHQAAYNSNIKGPLNSPGSSVVARQAFPFLDSNNNNNNNRSNPSPTTTTTIAPHPIGTRLVPANSETLSARILREANEQLDAHEERERKALRKYAPLIPVKTSSPSVTAVAAAGNCVNDQDSTPTSSEPDGSGIDTPASSPTSTSSSMSGTRSGFVAGSSDITKDPKQTHLAEKLTATSIAAPKSFSPAANTAVSPKKRSGRGARTKRSAAPSSATNTATATMKPKTAARDMTVGMSVDVDREAQRKAIRRAIGKIEHMEKGRATGRERGRDRGRKRDAPLAIRA